MDATLVATIAAPSGSSLDAAIAARADELKAVALARDPDAPLIDRALELVKSFLIEKRGILYGGLAIDYALRARGSRLYADGTRPDYDFYSPTNVDDAYELGERLARAGFPDVGVVRAVHVQTMRVRTAYVWVADISHAPAEVFARLPTLTYDGARVIHPDYQRLDMHLAFCFPFSNAPREDVFHRWPKDLRRFDLLRAAYAYPYPLGEGLRTPKEVGGGTHSLGGAVSAAPISNTPAPVTTLDVVGHASSPDCAPPRGLAAFGLPHAAYPLGALEPELARGPDAPPEDEEAPILSAAQFQPRQSLIRRRR